MHIASSRLTALARSITSLVVVCGLTVQTSGGDYRFTVGSRTIARASALEPVPEQGQSDPEVIEDWDDPGMMDEMFIDPYANEYWMSFDYLLWWRKGRSLPPLVTTSTAGTAFTDAGVLGLGTTSLLYGGQDVGNEARPGGRFAMGAWCDPYREWSVGGQVSFLGSSDTRFQISSADTPIIARPFLNVTDNQVIQQDALVIAFPGIRTGTLVIDTSADLLTGDLFLRRRLSDTGGLRVDFQYGYQFSRIDESLTLRSDTNALDLAAELRVFDQFKTRNEFHGGSLGLLYSFEAPRWSWRALAKIGLGNMHQSAQLSGEQVIDDGVNAPVVTNTGLLVQSTNRGLISRNTFTAVPEFNLNGIFHVTESFDLSLGYTFIYWDHVLQPAGTIDPNLAVNLAVPPVGQRPASVFNESHYWTHGLNMGIVWRY